LAGDQEQSNAIDQDERIFEVVKLRIAFLQHITTLSGAAIVIILALAERAEPPKQAVLLMSSIIYFLAAALIVVFGVLGLLLRLMQKEQGVGSGRGTTGTYTTLLAGMVFSVGMLNVASYATGGTRSLLEQKIREYPTVRWRFGGIDYFDHLNTLHSALGTSQVLWHRPR